jgi:hypothetical protein
MAASRAGASRASARAIDASDLRIALTSLPTDIRRGLRKRTSGAEAAGESYYAAGAGLSEGAGRPAEPSVAALGSQE